MERQQIIMSARHIRKTFATRKDEYLILDDISIDVKENEFLVLLGPGRCGKTVLMNIMAGLMEPSSGIVEFYGKSLTAPDTRIGFIFQRIGLLPWKTVMQNVEIGLKMRKIPKKARRETCQYYIDLVGLHGVENYYPRQLSGGMKQRVGIARAYANNAKELIMDEPFGSLDAQTRYSMEIEVLKMWEKEKRTVIFVTNNLEEALFLGDRIILLTKSPCSVKEVYIPDIEKPRDNMDSRFLSMRRRIESNTDLSL
ncbi:MAG: ABC transporter ATP-binding protein [Candidatus Humimicrobiaceae bacterium]